MEVLPLPRSYYFHDCLFVSLSVCLFINIFTGLCKYLWLDITENIQKMSLGATLKFASVLYTNESMFMNLLHR